MQNSADLTDQKKITSNDICVKTLTVDHFKSSIKGKKNTLYYGVGSSSVGPLFLLIYNEHIIQLSLDRNKDLFDHIPNFLKKNVSFTKLKDQETQNIIDNLWINHQSNYPLLLIGTEFQISVWQALLTIPSGKVVSYNDIAHMIHHPKAVRAVANAIGKNPILNIIPCHRVIYHNGKIGGFSCGIDIKEKLLSFEKSDFLTVITSGEQ